MTCQEKRAFDTCPFELAMKYGQRSYECRVCGKWHLTKQARYTPGWKLAQLVKSGRSRFTRIEYAQVDKSRKRVNVPIVVRQS